MDRTKIGYLVGGGLKENFRVRLIVSPQEIQEGAFVVIQSGEWNYYGIVTDIVLGATDPRFADEQMEGRFPAHIAQALHGQTIRWWHWLCRITDISVSRMVFLPHVCIKYPSRQTI